MKQDDECLEQLIRVEDSVVVMLNEYEEDHVISWETIRQFKLAVFELLLDWEKAKNNV
jgi:hypothetical protein